MEDSAQIAPGASLSRKKSVLVSAVLIIVLSMPAVLGYNVLSGIQPLGEGSTIMDLEDFIVSNNLLKQGSQGYVLFCTPGTTDSEIQHYFNFDGLVSDWVTSISHDPDYCASAYFLRDDYIVVLIRAKERII